MMKLLRDDLIIYPAKDDSNKFFIKDPSTNEMFEFEEKEYYLINAIKSPYHERVLLTKFNAKFREKEPPEYFSGLIAMLDEWGLLKDEREFNNASESRRQTVNTPQINRWHLFRPEKILDLICHLLYPLRYLVWLIPLLLLFSLAGILFNLQEVANGLATAKAYLGLIGRLIFAGFTVSLISQFFKGAVAHHFGLQVPSFGIMLIFGLIPRFNVHIVPSPGMAKAKRLWLSATSTLARLVLFGFGTILWLATKASGSLLPSIGAELAFLSAIGLLLVANPLWKGDGYNFLAAFLEMPNLRQRANNALRGMVSRRPDVIERYAKQSSFAFVLYALASIVFLAALIAFLVYMVAQRLVSQYQGAGVTIFLLLVGYVVFNFRRKAKSKKLSEQKLRENAGQQGGSTGKGTMSLHSKSAEAYPQTKASMKWKWWRYLLLAVFVACMFLPYRYEPGGNAEIFQIAKREIYAETDGVIDQVNFDGGELVSKGTVIAQLAKHRQEKDVLATRALIQAKQKEIDKLWSTPSKESLNLAVEQLESAQLNLKYSTDETNRLENLFKQEIISLQEFEDAKEKMEVDKQQVVEKQASLEVLKTQVNPNEIKSAEAELQKLKEDLKFYDEQLRRTSLRMPIDGRIITMNLKDYENRYFEDGDLFAVVEDSSRVRVEISVPEADIKEVAMGDSVQLKTWSTRGRIFHGKVSMIEPTTSSTTYGAVVKVISIMPNAGGKLKTGLTGYAKIEGKKTTVIQAFTRSLLRFIRIEVWSWIP
ncbi:MAG: HlyD family efflux transporter periplasmic adaptor subunit [Planctomycetes bacterium]|nr:HlyD family efflux transporter periplasmic adaptor subunit [Planctomycetota bacterium]